MGVTLARPTPLRPDPDVSSFSCGHESLDDWLRRRALTNHGSGALRVYVVTDRTGEAVSNRVIAFDALASGGFGAARRDGQTVPYHARSGSDGNSGSSRD